MTFQVQSQILVFQEVWDPLPRFSCWVTKCTGDEQRFVGNYKKASKDLWAHHPFSGKRANQWNSPRCIHELSSVSFLLNWHLPKHKSITCIINSWDVLEDEMIQFQCKASSSPLNEKGPCNEFTTNWRVWRVVAIPHCMFMQCIPCKTVQQSDSSCPTRRQIRANS